MGALHIGNNIVVPTVVKTVEVPGEGARYGATMDTFFGRESQTATGVILYKPSTPTDIVIDTVNELGSNVFVYWFYGNNSLRSISIPNLRVTNTSSLDHAFYNCTNLVSVTLGNSSHEISPGPEWLRNAFYGCTSLSNVYINLGIANSLDLYYAFTDCTSLTSNPIPSLRSIGLNGSAYRCLDSCFMRCTGLVTFTFDNVSHIYATKALQNTFANCTNLRTLNFPALLNVQSEQYGYTNTDQFHDMLYGCNNVTVHFPSNMQAKIGNWFDVVNGFGGTNTTVLFDLEATE